MQEQTKPLLKHVSEPDFHGICGVFYTYLLCARIPPKQQKRQNLAPVQVKHAFCTNLTPSNCAQKAFFTVIYSVFCTSSTPFWSPKICKSAPPPPHTPPLSPLGKLPSVSNAFRHQCESSPYVCDCLCFPPVLVLLLFLDWQGHRLRFHGLPKDARVGFGPSRPSDGEAIRSSGDTRDDLGEAIIIHLCLSWAKTGGHLNQDVAFRVTISCLCLLSKLFFGEKVCDIDCWLMTVATIALPFLLILLKATSTTEQGCVAIVPNSRFVRFFGLPSTQRSSTLGQASGQAFLFLLPLIIAGHPLINIMPELLRILGRHQSFSILDMVRFEATGYNYRIF